MPSVTVRVNLTNEYAIAAEAAAKAQGVSVAEIVRQGLRSLWGESLEKAPINGSPVQPSTPTPKPAKAFNLDDLDELSKFKA